MRLAWHDARVTPWFDTHVHLDRYAPAERAAVLSRAFEAGVATVGVAVDLDSSLALAQMEGLAGYSIGVHPLRADTYDGRIEDLARRAAPVAIGECGFDAGAENIEQQALVFREQCKLARSLRLPMVLHIDGGGAWESLLAAADAMAGVPVVRHYFTGDSGQAAWHREQGHYLAFGNPLRRRADLREIARDYPPELLLIETDSYPLPGRMTEPAHVRSGGETLALLRGWTFAGAREQLAANTLRAFPGLTANERYFSMYWTP